MDRPRRSGRASNAPALGYPSPTVSQHPTPPPQPQRMSSSNSASSSRFNVPSTMGVGSSMMTMQGAPMYNHGGQGMSAPTGMYGSAPSLPGTMQPMMNVPPAAANPTLNSFPLARTAVPVPPQLPIGPGQARFTTFASRAKMGVSTLMQPLPSGPDAGDQLRGLDYGTTERTRAGGTRRRAAAGMRYYGEDASDFDEEDDQRGGAASTSKANTPVGQEEEEPHQPGALLGAPPPGNKIFAKRAHRAHPIVPSESELIEQAEKKEFLIPIKIELETDSHRIRDTFAWNLRERIIKPRDFARVYVRDLDLPNDPFTGLVEAAIVDQIKLVEDSGLDLVEIGPAAGGPFASKDGKKRAHDVRNWNWGIKRHKASSGDGKKLQAIEAAPGMNGHANGAKEHRWDTEGADGNFEDDLRVVVDYDVQIYRHHLRDRMEWDLCSPLTPEAFAAQMCKDLCLSGEALPIISNAVREQLINHMRSAIELDLIGKGTEYARWQQEIEDAERDMAEDHKRSLQGLPPLPKKPLQVMQEEPEEEPEVLGPRRRRPGDEATQDGSAAATPAPSKNVILRTPEQRKSIAEFFQFQLTERGPRKLEGVWREYHDSREFGPLLELLTNEDLERIEADAIRASRRGRRDQQRNVGRRKR